MRARAITRCGVMVALLAASAWVTVPLGPVPFTLQTMALAAVAVMATPGEALLSVALYLVLGAAGVPVFSGFGAGLATIAGPTGGYLWGFLVGMGAAQLVRQAPLGPEAAREAVGVVAMLAITYVLGTIQFSLVAGVTPVAAAGVAVVPFLVPDAAKLAVGVAVGRAVRHSLAAIGAQEA